jgi:putative glutamine amidotransferase
MMNKKCKMALAILAMAAATVGASITSAVEAAEKKPVIGITWKSNTQDYTAFKKVIEAAGGTPVELDQVTSKAILYGEDNKISDECIYPSGMLKEEYADAIKANRFDETNVKKVMKGIDGVFFTGGEDISPSLFKDPKKEENMGEGINATRDISDYTLMSYCVKKNIPVFAVCRGEQMMGIVHGVTFIQDIPVYYQSKGVYYDGLHRAPVNAWGRDYARHNVEVFDMPSHLHDIVGGEKLENVSSWHHQAIGSLEGTDLIQTARTVDKGVEIVEGIENPKKKFCVAVQFHPENDLKHVLVQGEDPKSYMDQDIAMKFFTALVEAAKK